MLPIAGSLGFAAKLHWLSSIYEQSFLFLFTCSREGTRAYMLLQLLRTYDNVASAVLFKEADSQTLKRGCLIDKY